MEDARDMIIIGAGPGGMSAGIYASVYNLDTKIITKGVGGKIEEGHKVENYPGLGKLSGVELAEKFKEHLNLFDVPLEEGEVRRIEKKDDLFTVILKGGEKRKAKTVLIATGTQHRKLNIPGEKEYDGKGVSYCATCDAPLFKDAVVAVVGGSDSAAKEALLLSEHAKKVYIIYRGEEIHPEPINMKRIQKKVDKGEMEIINNTNVKEIKGDQMMNRVDLDNEYKGSKELELEGLFIDIGGAPLTSMLKDLDVELDQSGAIKIDKKISTNVEGLYAAGDITDTKFKQVITAAYQGSRAVLSAYQHIKSME